MEKIIKKLPLPICGLMLGLAALGNLFLSYGNIYRNILGILSAIILVLLIIKIVSYPKAVAEDLKNPVIASVFPTFSMGIMILSTYIKPYAPSFALILWVLGLTIHILLIAFFTTKFILNFDMKKVFPSYFIVYVGIVVGSISAPAFNLSNIGQYLFWFGFVSYIILLPIVLFRVFCTKGIPEPALPTIAIFTAPASLCLAGYMASFKDKNMVIVWFLLGLCLIMLLGVLLYLPKLLKLKFYPSYSAFTFPFVISGIALKQTNKFLIDSGNPISSLNYLVKFSEVLALVLVIYVLIKYTIFLFASNVTKSTNVSKGI